MQKKTTHDIRDPVHGFITLTAAELALLDHPALQRLRNIKQLGFSDLAFPGATHTRYSHSLGAMHMATRLFDALFEPADFPTAVYVHFRQAVRLAMLLHDVGHPPFSHAAEVVMPPAEALKLPADVYPHAPNARATHEGYTLKLLLDSSFTQALQDLFRDLGVTTQHLVALIGRPHQRRVFTHGGVDYTPILQHIVSSECDADRMDYLQRDSFFCGVDYGRFDVDWLIRNTVAVQRDGAVHLGIFSKALFAFEDFLLSRYHMFASVYLHHTPVLFSELLRRYFCSLGYCFTLPADVESYLSVDDITIWNTLRTSLNTWARLIIQRRPYYLLMERRDDGEQHNFLNQKDMSQIYSSLLQHKLEPISICCESALVRADESPSDCLYVLQPTGATVSLKKACLLYQRYKTPLRLKRIYVPAAHKQRARSFIATAANPSSALNESHKKHAIEAIQ